MGTEIVQFHSKMSPSASDRWLNCSGSVEVNARAPNRTNFYAEEGTAAHSLLEMCLRIGNEPEAYLGVHIYKDFAVTEEMADAVGTALDYVRSYEARYPKAYVHMEQKVDPARLLGVEKDLTSGTSDIIIDNAPVELVSIDYKHGAGVGVDVEDNTQLLLYMLGYVSQHATQKYKTYRIVVIQPRHNHTDGPVREVEITHDELMAFATKVKKRLQYNLKNPHAREAGTWCKWCAGAGTCRALAEYSMQTAAIEFGKEEVMPIDPNELDEEEISFALNRISILEKWIKSLYAAALEHMLRGGTIEGQKLVHGRMTRGWSNEKPVVARLERLNFELDVFAPRSLVGVAKVEEMLKQRIAANAKEKGIKNRAQLKTVLEGEWKSNFKALVRTNPPAIHIAPVNDPRAPVTRGSEFEAVPCTTKAPAARAKREPTARKAPATGKRAPAKPAARKSR